ncbi:hypothetical protein BKA82DRAFT_999657 [Pisolithus tinctorius]|uniref:Uncharacterized protein n=1 Tax=Pisolithus tinctorius Marx 270 TaxID=870435 RepID=A0A0C3NYP6_PISTI|nr:hypothetical protein BKA82DRAFT_999657 [Pisolithus tinctorius]KIO05935.1 hypothetical protein M404DRAFT_999657 [Pisolithus tinctorius Marx 270]
MAHLQRIMLDARAGISKHELWLAARSAGQTTLSRDNYTVGTQETASSTGTEAPSASIVQQTPDSEGGSI